MKSKFVVLLICIILAACDREVGNFSTPTDTVVFPVGPTTIAHAPTPAPIPTATWLPLLAPADAELRAIELLQDNGGCQLPCFMGIVPHQTTYQTEYSYMYQFANIRSGGLLLSGEDSTIKISIRMKSSDDPFALIRSVQVSMWSFDPEQGGLFYVFDDPSFLEYVQYYSLPSILTIYGPPSKAFVSLTQGEMGSDDIFHLILDYPKKGWRVDYWMPFHQDGEFYVGCPSQAFIAFALWEPGDTSSAKETESWFTSFYSPTLDEAIDMSIDEFYEEFNEPTKNQCLKTPVDIWPWEN